MKASVSHVFSRVSAPLHGRMPRRLNYGVTVALGAVLALAPPGRAADDRWVNSAGGTFQTGSNWSSGFPPAASDNAIFDLGSAGYPVTFDGQAASNQLLIGQDVVTFSPGANGGRYDVHGTMAIGKNAGESAALTITGGQIIGAEYSGEVDIGGAGTGTLTVTGGYFQTGRGPIVLGAGGTLTVSGGGSLQANDSTLVLLPGGHATLDGATLFFVGSLTPSGGFITYNSGNFGLESGSVTVGPSAELRPGPSGSITVAANSQISAVAMTLDGIDINLTGGAIAIDQLARTTNGGRINFTGGSLQMSNGDLAIGPNGLVSPSVTLNPLDQLTVSGATTVAVGGTLTLNGGSLETGTLDVQGGFKFINGSTLTVDNGDLTIDDAAAPPTAPHYLGANVALDNDSQVSFRNITVGDTGTGTLAITALSGVWASGNASGDTNSVVLGNKFGSSGTVTVGDGGHLLVHPGYSGHLIVGNAGAGLLSVNDAGYVQAADISIGSQSGSMGTLDVNGGTASVTGVPPNRYSTGVGLVVVGGTANSDGTNSPGGTGILNLSSGDLGIQSGKSPGSGALVIYSHGAVHLNGGSLEAGSIDNSHGGTFDFSAGKLSLTNSDLLIGPGGLLGPAVELSAAKTLSVSGTTSVAPGASLTFTGGMLTTEILALQGTLSFNSGAGGLLIDYGKNPSPDAAIRAAIITGRAGGTWNGPGINSSTAAADPNRYAVGYADMADFPSASHVEEVRLTVAGDANLDGKVGFDDLLAVARNYGKSSASWDQGDFNYDGKVGFDDLVAVARNYGQTLTAAQRASFDPSFRADIEAAFAELPEPSAGALALVVAAGVLSRRRAHRSDSSRYFGPTTAQR